MEALAGKRQSPSTGLAIALWGGGALLAVLFGVAAATLVAAVAGLIAVLAASAIVVVAFTATRWALLALLFLLYSYAGWVLGHTVGGPEVSQVLLLIIIAALAWRHLERTERFSLPGELIAVLILGVAIAASAAFTTDAGAGLRQIWDFIGYGLTVVALSPSWIGRSGCAERCGPWSLPVERSRSSPFFRPAPAQATISPALPSPGRRGQESSGSADHSTPTSSVRCSWRPRFWPSTWLSRPVIAPAAGSRWRSSRPASGHWPDWFARGPGCYRGGLLPDPSAGTDPPRHRRCNRGSRRHCGPGLHAIRSPGSDRPIELILGLPGGREGHPGQR